MPRINWREWEAITVTLVGAALAFYFIGRYAFRLFSPFIIAFLLALLTRPIVRYLAKRTGWSQRWCAVGVTLLALFVLGTLCYFLCSRLLLELQRLMVFLIEDSSNPDGELSRFFAFFRNLYERIPFLERLRRADFLKYFIGDTESFVAEQIRNALTRLSNGITAGVASLLRGLPSLLLFLLVTVISCFYFSVEYETVGRALSRLVPRSLAPRLADWKVRAGQAIRRYLRAYFLLFLLTLVELTVGFLILRLDYAFLFALLTAVLDILPVLGVGTVLVPFAIFSLAVGNVFRGVGLLVLYVIITVVRQIAESHLVGKSLGLHPILMLVSFYAGFKLFGVAGVFIGPALALLAKSFLERGGEKSIA